MQRFARRESGFTLVELLVTIVIISILASVGLVTYSSAQRSARISKRIQDLKAIETALELYKNATGSYPTQSGYSCIESSLTVLVPTYMPTLPRDPLQTGSGGTFCYQYQGGGVNYKVRTNGVPNPSEMAPTDYAQQPGLVDPVTANTWAVFSGAGRTSY